MIVVDTGGLLALLNADDAHHEAVRSVYDATSGEWLLPWAILPEVDYLAGARLGPAVAEAFAVDVRDGLFRVDAGVGADLRRACSLLERYRDLRLGLVDAVVMAQAERNKARAIITTDARHVRAVRLQLDAPPILVPIDGVGLPAKP